MVTINNEYFPDDFNVKNIEIKTWDIINNKIKIISDVYYKKIGKDKKPRTYFKIECLLCGGIDEAI